MSQNGSFILRLVGVVLMIGLLAAVGVVGYQSGVSQGIAQSPAVATAISSAQQSGQSLPFAPGYAPGYYPWMGIRPHFGFLSIGGILVFGLLFLMALRLIFRPRCWYPGGPMSWGGMHAYHGHPWGPPPWTKEGSQEKPEQEKKDKAE